jgi:hypothetical protein
MESFERRDFVIWLGAGGDAARAPFASRDAVQSAKNQVQTIWIAFSANLPVSLRLGRLFRASVVKILARCAASRLRFFLADTKNPVHQIASS